MHGILKYSGVELSPEAVRTLVRVGVLLVLGIPLVLWLARRARKAMSARVSSHQAMLAGKVVGYAGFAVIGIQIMRLFGFDLSSLLGAAGILGIAIGFASQTSASNLISGLFLVAEQPFQVGDVVTVGAHTGEVLSIDTLSVKLRTFDNKFVRIPNETIIKSEVANITRFPIRRIDLRVGVAYKEDLDRVRELLLQIAQRNPHCLEEPEARVILTGFGSSSVDILFAVWVEREHFLTTRNALTETVRAAFEREGIEIPFPHVSLYKGSVSDPIPIQLIGADGQASSGALAGRGPES